MAFYDMYEDNAALRQRVKDLEAELAAEKASHAKTMELLIEGEALRSKMQLDAVLNRAHKRPIRAERAR